MLKDDSLTRSVRRFSKRLAKYRFSYLATPRNFIGSSPADTLIPNNNNQIKNKYNTHGNNNDNDHDSSEKQE